MEQEARDQALSIVREKRDVLLRERAELRKQRATLAERDRQIDRELADCVAAARVFGTVLELPDDDESDDPFKAVWSARVFRDLIHGSDEETKKAKPPMPKIKDIVLDRLKAAVPDGTRAAPIRDYIIETYGEQIHEKTVGMTLYRLAKKGLVHREGITWFFGPLLADTKNPGAVTPGSTSDDLE